MTLNRADILAAKDIKIELLTVPEWGGDVYIKTLSGAERDQLEAAIIQFGADGKPKQLKLEKLRSLLAWLALCDADGNRLFDDEKDIAALGKKSAAALDRVASHAQNLAAISETDIAKLTDELKNDQPAATPST